MYNKNNEGPNNIELSELSLKITLGRDIEVPTGKNCFRLHKNAKVKLLPMIPYTTEVKEKFAEKPKLPKPRNSKSRIPKFEIKNFNIRNNCSFGFKNSAIDNVVWRYLLYLYGIVNTRFAN